MTLDEIKTHINDRPYMSGIDRDRLRVKSTGEVFTPTELVNEILDRIEAMDPTLLTDINKTYLDPACGDGQILGQVLIRKIERTLAKEDNQLSVDQAFELALNSVYGVDLMDDNATLCRDRLLCGQEHLRNVVTTNIVCHDGLTYDYSFNGTNYTDEELALEQEKARLAELGLEDMAQVRTKKSASKTTKSKKEVPLNNCFTETFGNGLIDLG